MHVRQLLKLLEEPAKLSCKDISDLEALVETYPYCYVAYALLAKAVYGDGSDLADFALKRAATYAIDRVHLRKWLEDKLTPLSKHMHACMKPKPEIYDENSCLDIIAQKPAVEPIGEATSNQVAMIDAILNKNLHFGSSLEIAALQEAEMLVDLSKQSISLDERLVTETLAKIMTQQRKYKRAIEIYEHLGLKYPEKKTYFADIISNLNCEH